MVESLPGLDPGTAATLRGASFVFLVESLPGLDPGTAATLLGGSFVFLVESLPGLDPGTAVTLLGCTFVYLVESLPGLDPLHLFAKPVGQPPRLVLPDWACASWCKLVKCWINQSYIIEITLSQLNAQNLA